MIKSNRMIQSILLKTFPLNFYRTLILFWKVSNPFLTISNSTTYSLIKFFYLNAISSYIT